MQAVSKWENEQSLPDIPILPYIADYFKVSMDELFFGENPTIGTSLDVSQVPRNGELYIVQLLDGKILGKDRWEKDKPVTLKLKSEEKISLNIWGDANIGGDISGGIYAAGSVTCGNVSGGMNVGNMVSCSNVSGGCDAGNNISCGNISGNIDCEGEIRCETIKKADMINCETLYCKGGITCETIRGEVHVEREITMD